MCINCTFVKLYNANLVRYVVFIAAAVLLSALASLSAYAQTRVAVSGHVYDAASGETLVGVNVRAANSDDRPSATNTYGFFSMTLPIGRHELVFSRVGYQSQSVELVLNADSTLRIELTQGERIEEVVVSQASRRDNIENPQMGVANVSIQDIRRVPVLFGEQDVLKTLQLLPGVMSGGEGSTSFFVRGGTGDQNLVLLDEAIVYNASHLFGFFSTFNSDAIKDVNLYKGSAPAQYGGRLSSVLDISMLDGNNKRFGMEGGIGLIASRLNVQGPIVKDNGSFIVSGRRTYADMFLKLSKDPDINQTRMFFYDLNVKANYRFDERNALYVSGYFGKDLLGYSDLFDFDWGNATATLRWNHLFSNRLFSNTTLVYSDFNYHVTIGGDSFNFRIASNIRNANFKQDFQFVANGTNTFRFGVNGLFQRVSPSEIAAEESSRINSLQLERRHGLEAAGYVSHEWRPLERLNLTYGLRLNSFLLFGPGTFHTYDTDGDIVSSKSFGRAELAQRYLNLEPRMSLSYELAGNNSVKASYSRNTQNLHQLSNSTSTLPTDAWVMSSNNIKPQIADQVAVGFYQNLDNDRYEVSVETYYKDMRNQIDYRDAADLQANEFIESELLYGIGRAYGLELYARKRSGRLSGWLSYTLSRSERQFDGIDGGRWFAARQDRTHDLSAVATYHLSPRWSLSSTFVYSTGNAVTFPSGRYQIDGQSLWYYTERNGYRMPDYHRLDIGATLDGNPNNKFKSSWTFGIYNVYNRKNAYIIDFRESEANPNLTETYRIALFGIIPSVTWNFKF